MHENENKKNGKNVIMGTLFLIWFFGSIAAMLVCSKAGDFTGALLVLLGQYFLVFGMIAVVANRTAKPFPFIVLLFPIVGIALLVCGVCILLGGELTLATLERYAPYILMWIFPIAGVVMIMHSTAEMRHLKRVCTYEMQAKCIDIITTTIPRGRGRGTKRVCMPVYSIFYNGEDKTLKNNTYTNLNRFEIGTYYDIKINPGNPDEFIDLNNKKGNSFILVLGIVFVVVTVPAIIYMYINGIG